MNSEKVKEIKKGLECCYNSCTDCPYDRYDKGLRCTDDLTKDALTLINELEKENRNNTDTITDLLKKQEFYETKKLKQFSERLKENMPVHYTSVINSIDETLKEFLKK